jgi:hypothetical protein
MANNKHGIGYVIFGIIILPLIALDYHEYSKGMMYLEKNCWSWNHRETQVCIDLLESLDSIFLEMVLLSTVAAIFILLGIKKMYSPQTDFLIRNE